MRLLGRLLVLLLTLYAGLQFGAWLSRDYDPLGRLMDESGSVVEGAKPSPVYPLAEDRWLDLPLQAGDRRLKLITYADLPAGLAVTPEQEFVYAMRYRLLSGDGRVLREGVFWHHTRLTRLTGAGERSLAEAFYLPAVHQPLDGRVSLLNLAGMDGASRLQVKALVVDQPLQRIVLRAYRREAVAGHKLGYLWRRMSQERRRRVGDVGVYPPELLREQEKRELLSWRWAPLGPSGVEGVDYQVDTLYRVDEPEGEVQRLAVPPAGLVIGPGVRGVVVLPDNAKKIRLQLQAVEAETEPKEAVLFTWYGRPATRVEHWQRPWSAGLVRLERELTAGILEVTVPTAASLRVWMVDGDDSREITPRPSPVRLYRVGLGESPRFHITAGDAVVPLRIDLRRVVDQRDVRPTRYRLLDAQQNVLARGELPLSSQPSHYDLLRANPQLQISEVSRHFIAAPAAARTLQLDSVEEVLVNVALRPPQLAHRSILNDDPDRPVVPSWFMLRPEDYAAIVARGGSVLATLQRRPPEIQPELLLGQYRWESFQPHGQWAGRYLLVPPSDPAGLRDEALPHYFTPVAAGRLVELDVAGQDGFEWMPLQLLYIREADEEPMRLQVELDDRVLFSGRLGRRSGSVDLGAISIGSHRMKISTDRPARFMVNGQRNRHDGRLKRFAIRLANRPLVFDYLKQDAEAALLSLRFHEQLPAQPAQRIRVQVEPVTRVGSVFDDWTLSNRLYEVAPSVDQVEVLGPERRVGAGRTLFIPLGRDLPAGAYRIRVAVESGVGGYAVLSHTRVGRFTSQQVLREGLANGPR